MLDMDAPGARDGEPGREAFLLAATRLINQLGYRGASVQRIASELNVTKGSFYHHLDAKDDLVAACYRRSFDTITAAQQLADAAGAATGTACRARSRPCSTSSSPSAAPPAHQRAVQPVGRGARADGRSIEPDRAALCGHDHGRGRRRFDPRRRRADRSPGADGDPECRLRHAQMGRNHGAPRAIALYASTILYGMFDDRFLN